MIPSIDLRLFLSTFGLIFAAELPDKTILATVLMATRKHPIAVFWGVAAAFALQSLIAVTFGRFLVFLPPHVIKVGAGLLFLGFAVSMWRQKEPSKEELHIHNAAGTPFLKTVWDAFLVIFIAEWGDLTQLTTAALTAKHNNPVTIFLGATLALWSATGFAVIVGHRAKSLFNPYHLHRAAAIIFAGIGLFFLIHF